MARIPGGGDKANGAGTQRGRLGAWAGRLSARVRVAAALAVVAGTTLAGFLAAGAVTPAGTGLQRGAPAGVPATHQSSRLEFEATFAGSRLNTKIWDTCYPFAHTSGCTNFGNREYEWYVPGQVKVYGGALHLVSERKPTVGRDKHGHRKIYPCRSGMVTTYPGFRFKYGRVQVVARIPYVAGMWPALWFAAANLQWPPEIDLLEHWGANNHTELVLHAKDGKEVPKRIYPGNLSVGWHTFTLVWTKSKIVWSIDGHTLQTLSKRIPQQKMYFIANVADYRAPASASGCQGQMLIKSVQVWNR